MGFGMLLTILIVQSIIGKELVNTETVVSAIQNTVKEAVKSNASALV